MSISNIFLGCLIEYNTDYFGNDIVNKVVETRQACADLCASTPDGLFWTFNTVHKKCHVKSSSSGRKTNQASISGNRKCQLKSKLMCKNDIAFAACHLTLKVFFPTELVSCGNHKARTCADCLQVIDCKPNLYFLID